MPEDNFVFRHFFIANFWYTDCCICHKLSEVPNKMVTFVNCAIIDSNRLH